MEILNFLNEYSIITIFIRLFLSALFGGIIGFERGRQGHPAGIRTHILVCLGSALALLVGIYSVEVLGYDSDPTRIGAQVISGIGFLGVGTILIKGRDHITGLTTAAGLWATAAVGLALGAGFYSGAVICTIIIFISISILHKLNDTYKYKADLIIYAEINDVLKINSFYDTLKSSYKNISIHAVPSKSNLPNHVGIEITFKYKDFYNVKTSLLKEIRSIENVVYALEAD